MVPRTAKKIWHFSRAQTRMVEPRRALSTLPGNRLLARRGEAAGAGRGVKKTLSSLCTGAVQCAPIAAAPASVEVHRSQEIEVACSSFESIALGRATQVELPPYRDDDAECDAEIERITFAAKRAVALPISIHALEKRADGGSWGRSGSAPNLPALAHVRRRSATPMFGGASPREGGACDQSRSGTPMFGAPSPRTRAQSAPVASSNYTYGDVSSAYRPSPLRPVGHR